MDLLRETRGTLSGDPYSFEEPLRLTGETLYSNFYINGMRHSEGLPTNWDSIINKGDSLVAQLEEGNQFDPFAVKVLTIDDMHVGYIPGIYAQAVHALLKNQEKVKLTVKQVRPNFTPQWWVKVELAATVEMNNPNQYYRKNLDSFIFKEIA
ncbi:hypothetical protein GCM10008935_26790 [Alkalibacillus silvisoli]|uniref:HIRAN domain-containing protein n=2 Tax=Alkalibacillus silvisoli TaxID=392823 RepID=A0ABN1A7N4_9BACI